MAKVGSAVASDIALHGFVYLGVLLTFVGVFGFLFFAFRDVPDAAQPLIELGIPLIFFVWAWALRRRRAVLIGKAMELLGGMVLPIVVFASLVDNAPVPPDFRGGALIAAMMIACLLIGVGYAWWSRRHQDSAIGFLVAPMIWLAGLVLGFIFKIDEPLEGVAITRLVSFQPALAATAITTTLSWLMFRSESTRARSAAIAAIPGVAIAYVLTVGLAVGEGLVRPVPLLLAGASTLISVELLTHRFAQSKALSALRPLLLATTLAPLIPVWGLAWTGTAMVASYLAVLEWDLRIAPTRPGLLVASAGAVVGLGISLLEPWPMVAAWATASIWSHIRRIIELPEDATDLPLDFFAAFLPLGLGAGLLLALPSEVAWLVMSLVVTGVAAVVRWFRRVDQLLAGWATWAASVIAVGSALSWTRDPVATSAAAFLVAAILLAAASLAGVPFSLALRVWLTSGALSLALAVGLDAAEVPVDFRPVVWALVGLAPVIVAAVWRRGVSPHLGLIGHLVGLGSLLAASADWLVAVLGAWTVGWLATVFAGERGGRTVSDLLAGLGEAASGRLGAGLARIGRSLPPIVLAASVPFAVLELAGLWEPFARNRAWSGATLGLLALAYAATARWLLQHRPLSSILGTGAAVLSLIGVAVAAPQPWESIVTAASSIAVAGLLVGEQRKSAFTWFAWLMSFVLVVLLAGRLGVADDSLDLVALAWGGLLLVGGLALDDMRAGRRQPGEGLRIAWIRHPVVLGALAVPLGLGPTFSRGPNVLGWWSLGAALGYFVVAYLLRAGAVTGPAYALTAVAVTVLSPVSPMAEPWLFVVIAAVLVACSWATAPRQAPMGGSGWLRWDVPPLVVAHVVAGVALARAAQVGEVPWTALGFGALSILIGLSRRNRAWSEAGNVLLLIGAAGFGPQWLALALIGTAARAVWSALTSTRPARIAYQAAAALSAGWSFLQLIVWQGWTVAEAVSIGAVVFGGLAVIVAGLTRFGRLARDWATTWGGLSVLGMVVTVAAAPGNVEGPLLSIGLGLFAAACAVAARLVSGWLHAISIGSTAGAWLALAVGLDWDTVASGIRTAIVFGILSVVVTETTRQVQRAAGQRAPTEPQWPGVRLARGWSAFSAFGVLAAAALATATTDARTIWLVVGSSFVLLAIAVARGAVPLQGPALRDTSGLSALAAVTAWAIGLGASAFGIGLGATALGIVATALLLTFDRKQLVAWLRPLTVTGTAANLQGLVLAMVLLPERALLVAVLLALGVQAVAVGWVRRRPVILAFGPPLICIAWLGIAAESFTGSSQWYTAPVAITLLAEVEIIRTSRLRGQEVSGRGQLRWLEWAGLGLQAISPLAEMFSGGILFGLVAFGYAAVVMIWAILTRIRRRLVAALIVATVTAALTISSAAASAAPTSAFFWIMAAGTGLAVMLTIGIVESYRSRSGAIMHRLDLLMEGWE